MPGPITQPRTAPTGAAPARPIPARRPVSPSAPATSVLPVAPDYPTRWQLLMPRGARNLLASWGWWQNPVPLIPSDHLAQTLAVLDRYGWARSLDFSPTGRMCIRGAQTLLQTTGHVTPASRARAVDYMQQTLAEHGVHEPFFAWNDHTQRTFAQVSHLITLSSHTARKNGE